jgi:hypothetical protein
VNGIAITIAVSWLYTWSKASAVIDFAHSLLIYNGAYQEK